MSRSGPRLSYTGVRALDRRADKGRPTKFSNGRPDGGGETTGENAERIKEGIEHFNRGNIPAVLELYDPAAHIESSGTIAGGTFRGREGVQEWMQKIGTTWPEGLRLHVENLHETGDLVFVEWTQEGKLANGKESKQKSLNVFELHGGKVRSHRLYTDSEKIARDLGKM